MNNIAENIKQLISMEDVLQQYGFPTARNGRIPCPLHNGKDNNFSYKGQYFKCFVCGEGGTVIDFVMKLFDLNFRQAVLRLNADFQLGLTDSKPDRAARSAALEARREEQRRKAQAEANFRFMTHEFQYWKEIRDTFQPVRQGDTVFFHPFYVEAVKRLSYIEYWIDDFIEKGGKDHWETCPFTQEMIT